MAAGVDELRNRAIGLLARREHSRAELRRKLKEKLGSGRRGGFGGRRRARGGKLDRDAGAEPSDAAPPEAFDGPEFDARLEIALDSLEHDGLLSDARCAEMIVHARSSRGQGPRKIRQALRDAGIDDGLAAIALEVVEEGWGDVLARACEQRFGSEPPADGREWARRARFLAGRGFPEDLVRIHLGELPPR